HSGLRRILHMREIPIMDVTLRDGIMDHPVIPTTTKEDLALRIVEAGISRLEVARFPLDQSYPQFSDTVELLRRLQPLRPRVKLSILAVGKAGVNEALRYASLFDELHT